MELTRFHLMMSRLEPLIFFHGEISKHSDNWDFSSYLLTGLKSRHKCNASCCVRNGGYQIQQFLMQLVGM
jgi:hypothetical protein